MAGAVSADAAVLDSHQARAVPAATPPSTVNARRTTRRASAAVCGALSLAWVTYPRWVGAGDNPRANSRRPIHHTRSRPAVQRDTFRPGPSGARQKPTVRPIE